MTEPLYRYDSHLSTCEARVTGINERGGILLDRTIFFATGDDQPGDTGELERSDGSHIAIGTTVFSDDKSEITHVPGEEGGSLPEIGEIVVAHIDWPRRYRHMRMHTALHTICAAIQTKTTGAQIGAEERRIDLNMQDPPDRNAVHDATMKAIDADLAVTSEWITDEELDANPDLIKSMSVSPPRGSGLVRLVRIGDTFDLQPCGGTHVKSTLEIGPVTITKIEKKGRLNRRIRIRLDE
ncbi:alanyl-tRNA editing protein [Breoghania sp.]|uniref:alanyl-tRNA editing protein n=1 Tax=Breoghania sp. TaxID=2065378 RepID=UPI00260CB03E|nr:alanyl-tRNA editing protein [Breoghania sp.]MDJ0929720.1 alanyl-tRNA editing protein [Breoghania sp.]